jgi:putative selenium metabolism hydrolase
MNQSLDRIIEKTTIEYEACVKLLADLIACRSYSGHEKECADSLLNWCDCQKIPACRDERGSVISAVVPGSLMMPCFKEAAPDRKKWFHELFEKAQSKKLPILAYNAHMDVVEAEDAENWHTPPFTADRRDGRIYGRGTCDMKGALAAMAVSLKIARLFENDLPQKFLLVGCFVTEEEAGEGLAFKELCEEFNLRPNLVLLGEPSQMQIARGQRGKLEFYVETRGRNAHTSVPEVGDNAAYKMAKVLLTIEALDATERQRHGLAPEQMLKRNTLVATSIQSWPASRSFVPDRAQTHVTARTALDCDLQKLRTRLESSENWPEAEIFPIIYRGESYTGRKSNWPSDHPAWETPVDSDFFQTLQNLYLQVLKREAQHKIWPFSTDGVYSAGMEKIPTLGLGPGLESCAHIVDEWVSEEQLLEALQIYSCLPFAL